MHALVLLAEQPDAKLVCGSDIARALGVPANYLSKLLHQLTRAGVLRSVRGPQGGFCLARPADEVRLGEALAPIDAERLDRRCLLGRAECRDDDPCTAHEQWRALVAHIDRFFDETTLASLAKSRANRSTKARRSRRPNRKTTRRKR